MEVLPGLDLVLAGLRETVELVAQRAALVGQLTHRPEPEAVDGVGLREPVEYFLRVLVDIDVFAQMMIDKLARFVDRAQQLLRLCRLDTREVQPLPFVQRFFGDHQQAQRVPKPVVVERVSQPLGALRHGQLVIERRQDAAHVVAQLLNGDVERRAQDGHRIPVRIGQRPVLLQRVDHPGNRQVVAQDVAGALGPRDFEHRFDLVLHAADGVFHLGDRGLERHLHRDHLRRHHRLGPEHRRLPLKLCQELPGIDAGGHPEDALADGNQVAFLQRVQGVAMQLHVLAGLGQQ